MEPEIKCTAAMAVVKGQGLLVSGDGDDKALNPKLYQRRAIFSAMASPTASWSW